MSRPGNAAISVASTALPCLSSTPCARHKRSALAGIPSASLNFSRRRRNAQMAALPGQAAMHSRLGNIAALRAVKKSLLHDRMRLADPCCRQSMLSFVSSAKDSRPGRPSEVLRRNKRDQFSQGNHTLHLLRKLALAGFTEAQIEVCHIVFEGLHFPRLDSCRSHKQVSTSKFPRRNTIVAKHKINNNSHLKRYGAQSING